MLRFLLLVFLAMNLQVFAFQDVAPDVVLASYQQQMLTGYTRARAAMELTSEVSGQCLSVHGDVGDTIGEDGVFAALDPVFTRLDLERAKKELARLNIDGKLLEKDMERYRKLLAQEFVAASEFEDYQNRYEMNRVQQDAAGLQIEILEERLNRFTIKAPGGWKVIERRLEPGEWAQQGAAIAILGDYRTLYVSLAVDQAALEAIRQQNRLEVFLPDQGKKVPARLARVSPSFDPQTRKVPIDLAIDGALAGERGGLRVELEIRVRPAADEVLVPENALERRYDDYFVIRKDGGKEPVRLLGVEQNGYVRVKGNLRPGDSVRLGER